MSTPVEYERGDARDDALDLAASSSAFGKNTELYELTADEYWDWLVRVVEEGSEIDQELDDLLDQIYDCEPSFYSLRGRRTLQNLLSQLHEARSAVRAYEYDVEELTYSFARTDIMDTDAAENADMALSQIKETYNRAYDLCLYKLDRISNAWITASNFLISILMLIVTILFWMEFR
jgi:hypothetical protein